MMLSTAEGQQFGQWSWDGAIRVARQEYSTQLEGREAGFYGESTGALSLGLSGFVLNPAIARFSLGIGASLSKYTPSNRLDTVQWGYRGELSAFPGGSFPFRVFASKETYDYSSLSSEDPLTLRGTPMETTSWGGALRFREGLLSGLRLGLERSAISFVEPSIRDQTDEREFLDWSRGGESRQQHYEIERVARDYGTLPLQTNDYRLGIDERGRLAESWQWNLGATGARRESTWEGSSTTLDTASLRGNLTRSLGGASLVSLSYTGGFLGQGASEDFLTHDALLRIVWRASSHWELTPFVGYGFQSLGNHQLSAPRAGLGAGWHASMGTLDVSTSAAVNYSSLSWSGTNSTPGTSSLGYSAGASLSHAGVTSLSQELEVSWEHNQLRSAGEDSNGLPGLGGELLGPGEDDILHGRLKLNGTWGGLRASIWGDWTKRESSGGQSPYPFAADTASATIDLGLWNLAITSTAGLIRVDRPIKQEIEYEGASLSWRPWAFVLLTASYRQDHRRLLLQPSFDTERLEAGLDFAIGQLTLTGHIFAVEEQFVGSTRRRNVGSRWSLGRRFGGWLPIVSAPSRRGIVE